MPGNRRYYEFHEFQLNVSGIGICFFLYLAFIINVLRTRDYNHERIAFTALKCRSEDGLLCGCKTIPYSAMKQRIPRIVDHVTIERSRARHVTMCRPMVRVRKVTWHTRVLLEQNCACDPRSPPNLISAIPAGWDGGRCPSFPCTDVWFEVA